VGDLYHALIKRVLRNSDSLSLNIYYFLLFLIEDKDGEENTSESTGKDGETLLTNLVQKLENEVYQNLQQGHVEPNDTSDDEDWVSVDTSEDEEEEDIEEEIEVEEEDDTDQIGKTFFYFLQ